MLRTTQSIYLVDNFYDMVNKKEFQNFCKNSEVKDYENMEEVINNNLDSINQLKGRKQFNVRLNPDVSSYLDDVYQREKTAVIITAYLVFKQKQETTTKN